MNTNDMQLKINPMEQVKFKNILYLVIREMGQQ